MPVFKKGEEVFAWQVAANKSLSLQVDEEVNVGGDVARIAAEREGEGVVLPCMALCMPQREHRKHSHPEGLVHCVAAAMEGGRTHPVRHAHLFLVQH